MGSGKNREVELQREIERLKLELKKKDESLVKIHKCYRDIVSEIPNMAKGINCRSIIEILSTNIKEGFSQLPELEESGDHSDLIKEEFSHILKNYNKFKLNIKKSEDKYRRLFNLSPDAIILHKGEEIILCNEAAAKLVGVKTVNELIGRSIKDFLIPEDHHIMEKRMDSILKTGYVDIESTERVKLKNGKIINIESRATIFEYKDEPHIFAVIRDITERKKAEQLNRDYIETQRQLKEALEYDKLKNEFFANISHEFKTPLNVMLSTIQLMEWYINNEEYSPLNMGQKVKSMKQNCYRLLRLVNNLIDITKLDCGFMKLQVGVYDIVSILNSIIVSIQDYAISKDLNINVNIDLESKKINMDVHMIERIILNVISNAIKFTDPGGNIDIDVYEKAEFIYIKISDSGIGIPRNKLNKIFERFNQIDKSLTRNQEGSGIGLSIAKYLTLLHKGDIHAKSTLGEGSIFTIKIPVDTGLKVTQEHTISENAQIERVRIEFSDIYL